MARPSVRLRLTIHGAVQGVGFRPFVRRLADELDLSGWVCNTSEGVLVEIEGPRESVLAFRHRLTRESPKHSRICGIEASFLDPAGYVGFEIRASLPGAKTALVLPDLAACAECLAEVFDKSNRRYLYPFTNCTHCGPRFSIIEALPYDRANTTMRRFAMCRRCQAEYDDPLDRRFHAQPNACPQCGPHIELWCREGRVRATGHDTLQGAAEAIREGRVVALKGLGGFHLLVDARRSGAVARLRRLKDREEKPFALMYPSFEMVEADCRVSPDERRLLLSAESPIVLLQRTKETNGTGICEEVAPGNPCLGIMLPYTPLHHLLMSELGFSVVATSGNLKDEPICIDEQEALQRLGYLADLFLVHNRPILRPVDDSVVRVVLGRELVLRRARGYAPLPVFVRHELPSMLAVGGHLKDTVAVSVGKQVFISQHIGDLETPEALRGLENATAQLLRLYDVKPHCVACDAHPSYGSSQFARRLGLRLVEVQHHYAHVLACMAENDLEGPVLGVSWDGTGYGSDGAVWGGEFLLVRDSGFERAAHLAVFPLPGGETAIREPRRAALGVLYQMFGPAAFEMAELRSLRSFSPPERKILRRMLEKGLNTPLTSSAGRIFDAVASLCGLRQVNAFEGQAAMELEFAANGSSATEAYGFRLLPAGDSRETPALIDWTPTLRAIVEELSSGTPPADVSARFHSTLGEMIVAAARLVGVERVALTGGCFQNRRLTEGAVRRLREEGFQPYWHQRVPPNDGGIALGQLLAAAGAGV